MGKSTISMAIFNSKLLVYQRVYLLIYTPSIPISQPPSQRASYSDPMPTPPAPRLRLGRHAVGDATPKAPHDGWFRLVWDGFGYLRNARFMLGLCLIYAGFGWFNALKTDERW